MFPSLIHLLFSLVHSSIFQVSILSIVFILYDTEQDEDIAKLEETALSTKHIALAVNEELDLHAKLLVMLYFKTTSQRMTYNCEIQARS